MKPSQTPSPWLRRGVIAAVVIGLGVAGAMWWGRAKPVPVVAVEVGRGPVESSIANTRAGTVEACQRTRLSTVMGGRIELLNVKEGDRVRKGQLLMKLWNDDQQAQQTLAAAQRETARRRVVEACTAADASAREAKRQAELREQGFVSVSREEAARAEADARRAACQTAQSDVASAQARVGVTQVEQGRTHLYAPFDGRVARIVGEVGEYSTPSPPGVQTPPAIDLIDDSCLYIKAPMDEVDAPRIQPGQPVRITIGRAARQDLRRARQAGRTDRVRCRETGAHGGHRRDVRPAGQDGTAAGRLQRRCGSRARRAQGRAARARRGRWERAGGCWWSKARRWWSTRCGPGCRTGSTPRCSTG